MRPVNIDGLFFYGVEFHEVVGLDDGVVGIEDKKRKDEDGVFWFGDEDVEHDHEDAEDEFHAQAAHDHAECFAGRTDPHARDDDDQEGEQGEKDEADPTKIRIGSEQLEMVQECGDYACQQRKQADFFQDIGTTHVSGAA